MPKPAPPLPTRDKYSGKWVQRIPPKLHAALVHEAEVEGVSLNLYVATTLAFKVGERTGMRVGYARGFAEGSEEMLKRMEALVGKKKKK